MHCYFIELDPYLEAVRTPLLPTPFLPPGHVIIEIVEALAWRWLSGPSSSITLCHLTVIELLCALG